MKEENNIEQQLQAELLRLKKAIEYIEQAEKNIQQLKDINYENDQKNKVLLVGNKLSKMNLDIYKSQTDSKLSKIVSDLDKVSKTVDMLNNTIEQNQKEIERLKRLKWYQKLFI